MAASSFFPSTMASLLLQHSLSPSLCNIKLCWQSLFYMSRLLQKRCKEKFHFCRILISSKVGKNVLISSAHLFYLITTNILRIVRGVHSVMSHIKGLRHFFLHCCTAHCLSGSVVQKRSSSTLPPTLFMLHVFYIEPFALPAPDGTHSGTGDKKYSKSYVSDSLFFFF
jgi:hypothetical protein